ncbi:lytic transglycosylase [Azospira restricta]|uniref:LysM peptidoglycan-binding domain-containing protein n=1 Tax=Azospira restricta TaxID=404405 RepID=A0A974SMQ2_9RHOO|nr:LysM peptidoglycan-binding domain-containing protein [Azospira restricta]QRJ62890.1 LysM peptidoglycan-binding domain-containing protein [Azospira restricta]
MTFRITRALPLALLVLAPAAHASDAPLSLSAASSLGSYAAPEASEALAPAAGETGTPAATLPTTELSAPPTLPDTIDLTATPDDLFVRIRNGFGMPNLNGDLVLSQQQWYLNRPDYLRRMVDRSARYLHFIVEELERRGMPTELAFLPMVESAYNPMAYSRAHASGLWQFIPSTGKNYNLKQDWWMDQRRDIVAATGAALDYLQTIYDMHGDWFLALASYNWGEGAVARAIKKNEAKGLPTDYQSLTMPAETRNYVPKLQALKNIFSNPQLLASLDLPPVPNRAYFATVTPGTNIDVKVAAKLAEMPVQEFVALNPAHNRPVIKSETPLVIPAEKLETFQANLESHQEDDKPLSKWQTYTLKSGEKLEKVAPRFGITLADLKRVNGLNGRLKTTAGLTLLVPAGDGVGSADMAALPEQPRLPSADPAPAKAAAVVVRKGETLAAVARRTGVGAAELRRINRLAGDRIAPGTKLLLAAAPAPATTAPATKPAVRAGKAAVAARKPRVTRYTVKRGDTLYSIARQFKVEQQDLLRWNGPATKALQPGQQLTIQLAQNDD